MLTNSLAYTLITTFTEQEKRDFGYFMARPERKNRVEVQLLGKLLLKKKPVTEAQLTKALGADILQNRTWLNQLNSWLYSELKAFLHERNFQEVDELELIREFDRRNLPNHRDRLVRLREKHLEKKKGTLNQRLELELVKSELTDDERRTQSSNLQQVDDLLDRRFIQAKLRQACLMQAHENVFPSDYQYGTLATLLTYLDTHKLIEEPGIAAYYHALRFLRDPRAKEDYASFFYVIENHPNVFTAKELKELYLLAINYCIRQVNQGNAGATREVLDLYQRGLNQSIFLEGGHLTGHTYRNAVTVGLSLKEFAWAEQFIHEWNARLPKEVREKLLHYNLAKLAYAKGDTGSALEELRYVQSRDTLFILSTDVFRAKLYYERNELDLLDAHLDKMHIFLRRNQGSYHHRHYLNFVLFCRKIVEVNYQQKEERNALHTLIGEEKSVTERKWLLERLAV